MSGNPFLSQLDRDKPPNISTPSPSLQPVVLSRHHLRSQNSSPFRSPPVRTTAAAAATTLEGTLNYTTTQLSAYGSDRPTNFNNNNQQPTLSKIRCTIPAEVRHTDAHSVIPPPQPSIKPLQEVMSACALKFRDCI